MTKGKLSYAEFIELKEKLAKVEAEYLIMWKSETGKKAKSKKLSALANELSALNDQITDCQFYH